MDLHCGRPAGISAFPIFTAMAKSVRDTERGRERMSLYKRGNTWWLDLTTPGGKRVRRSTETSDKKRAKEYHDQVQAQMWRTEKLGEKPNRSWDEAALRFLKEAEGKASFDDYKRQIQFWTVHFRGQALESIRRERVADLVEGHANTPATRNRYVACLRAVLVKAAGPWEWTDKAPKLKTYREPHHRIRWLTKDEARTLLEALPAWLAQMARFSLATGLRQSNVVALEWSQIDIDRRVAWIHPDQAKARRAIGVPLNADAMSVIRAQRGKHAVRVFLGPDMKPMEAFPSAARTAWEKACQASGITNFRYHDLRHCFASWHVQAGTPLYALKELGGWQTLEMVKRYSHLAPEHLHRYAKNSTSQTRHKRPPD